MRLCRVCQRVNGDSEVLCRYCGTSIDCQQVLPPSTPTPRRIPNALARRNRAYLLLLLLIPLAISLNLSFWLGFMPKLYHATEKLKAEELQRNVTLLQTALDACRRDTGGVPKSLLTLREVTVKAGDLTPGASPGRWKGPYLPIGEPLPVNPYLPRDGVKGWRYEIKAGGGVVTPAHVMPVMP